MKRCWNLSGNDSNPSFTGTMFWLFDFTHLKFSYPSLLKFLLYLSRQLQSKRWSAPSLNSPLYRSPTSYTLLHSQLSSKNTRLNSERTFLLCRFSNNSVKIQVQNTAAVLCSQSPDFWHECKKVSTFPS